MPEQPAIELDQYSDEYLLELHSTGRTVAGYSQELIASELAKRGIEAGAPGQGTHGIAKYELPDTPLRRGISKTSYIIGAVILAAFLTEFLTKTFIGRVLSILLLLVAAVAWLLDLFNRKVEPNRAKHAEIKAQLSSLMLAAADGDIESFKSLIADGADVNEVAKDGTTALMYAARNNHATTIRLLLSSGARLSSKSVRGSTAIDIAERFSNQEALTALRESVGEA